MGLLSNGTPLSWAEAREYAEHVRKNAVEQLINNYNRLKTRKHDVLRWGDEVEYTMVECDPSKQTCRVSVRAEEVLQQLQIEMNERLHKMGSCCSDMPQTVASGTFTAIWQPEYGRYMIEGTPARPYCHDTKDLLCVESNMIARRVQAEALLRPHERILSIGNFPRLGCPDSFTKDGQEPLTNDASHSLFFPDEFINTHSRFKTLTRNIRQRRGSKVGINLPVYKDRKTGPVQMDEALFPEALPETFDYFPDAIHLDAMGFGMGCSCLQITFQACTISEARHLYDQLAVICPIALALTASTPIYRGYLSDVDCRWNVVSASADDRTLEERGVVPLACSRYVLPKSRYASISCFISLRDELAARYNDLSIPYNEYCFSRLLEAGFDAGLAKHFAWLFTRDPLVVFEELLEQDNHTSSDHFENIQSTNWQTMRFKPPPPNNDSVGWRVEFRPMEVQPTDFENAAFCVFVVLLTRVVLTFNLNFYIPISKVDENMEAAQRRDAVRREKFYFRRNFLREIDEEKSAGEDCCLYSADEIVNGCKDGSFRGLIHFIWVYLDSLNIDYDTRTRLSEYINFISYRASGVLMTPATWMRTFVQSHPEYKHDSRVSAKITLDMIERLDQITHESMQGATVAACCDYSFYKHP